MAEIKTFPQVIFVTVEEDGGNDYLLASLTKQDALNEPRRIVGTYQFVRADEVLQGLPISNKRNNKRSS